MQRNRKIKITIAKKQENKNNYWKQTWKYKQLLKTNMKIKIIIAKKQENKNNNCKETGK